MNVSHVSSQVLGTLEDLGAVEAFVRFSSAACLAHSLTFDVQGNGRLRESLHPLQEMMQRRLWMELANSIHRLVHGLLELLGASFEELDDLIVIKLPAQLWWMLQVPKSTLGSLWPVSGPPEFNKVSEL